jgi:ATP/maltotriose-dependent transcriptional regulator MalT
MNKKRGFRWAMMPGVQFNQTIFPFWRDLIQSVEMKVIHPGYLKKFFLSTPEELTERHRLLPRKRIISAQRYPSHFGRYREEHPIGVCEESIVARRSDLLRCLALKEREHQILSLLTQRYTNREIAEIVALSHRTVEYYIANLRRKMHVDTRTELRSCAIEWCRHRGFSLSAIRKLKDAGLAFVEFR